MYALIFALMFALTGAAIVSILIGLMMTVWCGVHTNGPKAIVRSTVTLAYGMDGKAPRSVLAALQPTRAFLESRLAFISSPQMRAILAIYFIPAVYTGLHENTLFAHVMPVVAISVVVGLAGLLRGVLEALECIEESPQIIWLVRFLPRPTPVPLVSRSLEVLLQPPRNLQPALV